MGFLPIDDGFCGFAEFFVGVTDVIKNHGVGLLKKRGGAKEFGYGFRVAPLAEKHPAKGVDISPVVRVEFQCAVDELLGGVQIFVLLGPHVGEEIVGIRIFGIEADGSFDEFRRLHIVPCLLGGGSVAHVERRIEHFGI